MKKRKEKQTRSMKQMMSVALAAVLLLAACAQTGFGSLAAPVTGQTEISVTRLKSGHNGQILTFYLSDSDYTGAVNTVIGDRHTEYSYWNDVKIYTGDTEYKTLGQAYTDQKYYNMWTEPNSVSVQLTVEIYNAATKIVIPANTVFPSLAYTNGGSMVKGGYVTKEDITFEKPAGDTEGSGGYDWSVSRTVLEKETVIEKIQLRDASGKLLFFLSEQDYSAAGATKPISEKISEYNTMDKIVLYTNQGSKTLAELYGGERYYNIWGETGSIAFDLIDGWNGTTVNKIVVKEGCQFPSYGYTDGGTIAKTAYIVKQEMVFTTRTSATDNLDWTLTDTSEPEEITVARLKSGHNGEIVTFYLSSSDYAGAATAVIGDKHTEYSYWNNIKVYTGDTEYKTLGEVYTNQKYYNMWTEPNSVSIQLTAETYNAVTKIVIPAGTVFPSFAYTNGSSAVKGGYVTKEDITFEKPTGAIEGSGGYDWSIYQPIVGQETGVKTIHVRGGKLLLFLSDSDYANTGATTLMGSKLFDYNLLNNIVLYTGETESKTLAEVYTGEGYFNVWGENGSAAFTLKDGYDGTTVTKVVVNAGSEFPSYAYTNGGSDIKTGYVVKHKTIFTATELTEENISFEKTVILESVPVDTEVSGVQIMGAANDMRLIVYLSDNDYADIGDSVAVSGKFKDYNTFSNIILYSGEQAIPLSEAVTGKEVYYNLWGNGNSVSYGLKPEYTAKFFDRVLFKAGCEFPAYAFTSKDTDQKTAYTTTFDKELAVTPAMFCVEYFDENGMLLYADQVACGEAFVLRPVPEKDGYTGSWSGMSYSVMPAMDISYRAAYQKSEENETEKNEPGSSGGETGESGGGGDAGSSAVGTGDTSTASATAGLLLVISMAAIVICVIVKKKYLNESNIGE